VAGDLPAGQTTVGIRVELEHLAPSPVGSAVRARAELVAVASRRLTFEVTLSQDGHEVARGQIIRAVVDRARFPA
jgi:predicted thioesterase